MGRHMGESVFWHIDIDALGRAFIDLIGLMKDSDCIIISCFLVKPIPSSHMNAPICVCFQVLEALPILNKCDTAPAKREFSMDKAELRILI